MAQQCFCLHHMLHGPKCSDFMTLDSRMHWQQQVHASRSTKPLPGQNWQQDSTLLVEVKQKYSPTKPAQGARTDGHYLGEQQGGGSSWATQTDVPGQTRSAIKNKRTHVKRICCTMQLVCAPHAHEICGVKHPVQASFSHSIKPVPAPVHVRKCANLQPNEHGIAALKDAWACNPPPDGQPVA